MRFGLKRAPLGVVGGIVGTALIYEAVEDELDCLEFDLECDD